MSIIVKSKTIEKAIADGLEQLNAQLEDVDVNVLNEGGVFKQAKIEMTLLSEKEEKTKKETKKEQKIEKPEISEEITKTDNSLNQTIKMAQEWLDGLIYAYNINAKAIVNEQHNSVVANIEGENLGVLIGYHGEVIEAIGHLLNVYLFNKNKNSKKVFLDVAGYRLHKIDELKETAKKLAEKVVENKRKYKLDPMNSFERRIVHEELSTMKNIKTHSEGKEPNRCLIIEFVEEN